MDLETYDQIGFSKEQIGDAVGYIKEQQEVDLLYYNEELMGVELPTAVELAVTETEPGVKGDTVSGGTKPATLESGTTIQVPLFIDIGDIIKVDTRTGDYLERLKKK
jgi:elongation factor P